MSFDTRPETLDYENYRTMRREYLKWQCMIVRHLNPSALDVVGIAVDPQFDEISEDALYLDGRAWDEELDRFAREIQEKTGIFKSGNLIEKRYWEYPIADGPSEDNDV